MVDGAEHNENETKETKETKEMQYDRQNENETEEEVKETKEVKEMKEMKETRKPKGQRKRKEKMEITSSSSATKKQKPTERKPELDITNNEENNDGQETELNEMPVNANDPKTPKLPPLSEDDARKYFFRLQMNSSRSRFFLAIMEALKQVEDGEINVVFSEKGLEISIMESTKISAARVLLNAEFWDCYEFFQGENPYGIRLHLKLFCEAIKSVKQKGSNLCLFMLREKEDNLKVIIWNDVVMNMDIPIYTLSDDAWVIPDITDYDLVFDVNTNWIKNLVNMLKQSSEVLALHRSPSSNENEADFVFVMTDQTRGTNSVRCSLSKLQNLKWGSKTNEHFKIRLASKFVHKYLQNAPSISHTVKFCFKEDNPLYLRYHFEQNSVDFAIWIAPKSEE